MPKAASPPGHSRCLMANGPSVPPAHRGTRASSLEEERNPRRRPPEWRGACARPARSCSSRSLWSSAVFEFAECQLNVVGITQGNQLQPQIRRLRLRGQPLYCVEGKLAAGVVQVDHAGYFGGGLLEKLIQLEQPYLSRQTGYVPAGLCQALDELPFHQKTGNRRNNRDSAGRPVLHL